MNIIEKIKRYFRPKNIIIYIPRKFENKQKRNRFLIETKKHILNITKIDI